VTLLAGNERALIRALIAALFVVVLGTWSVRRFLRWKTAGAAVQVVGVAALVVVVLAHVCEALRVLPGMRWGAPDSIGHYLDLSSAIVGVVLVPLGFIVHRRDRRHS
jgi:hypothetical protein